MQFSHEELKLGVSREEDGDMSKLEGRSRSMPLSLDRIEKRAMSADTL